MRCWTRVRAHRVHELAELLSPLRVFDDAFPLIVVRADEPVHLLVELSADTKLIIDDDLLQTVKATL